MMKLVGLKVKNFKNFRSVDIKLADFNLVIGANASGKSNFVNIFRFLKDISTIGLKYAIIQQGGVEWIRNINLPATEDLEIEIHVQSSQIYRPLTSKKGDDRGLEIPDICYKFRIGFPKLKESFEVVEEILESPLRILKFGKTDEQNKPPELLDTGKITLKREKDDSLTTLITFEKNILDDAEKTFLGSVGQMKIPPSSDSRNELVVLKGFMTSVSSYFLQLFLGGIEVFDIDPKSSKKAISITGKQELESDGSNLPLVLNRMLNDKVERETIQEIIKTLLPFVEGFAVKQQADRSLITYVSETYHKNKPIPSFFVSDGTINLLSLLVALYEKPIGSPTVVFEEPEKNIHPSLISTLVEVLKDISEARQKQIVITTHNPQIVKEVKLENIILISRRGGFSRVSKPVDKPEVQEFLKEDLGVDELYMQNLLEW
jgi:predicted ATPase